MEKPIKTAAGRKRSAERSARDAFVMIAITLVVAALGLGLYMQFGLNFWLSLLVALTAYAALITVHALVRRGQVVAALEAEIRDLKAQIDGADRVAGGSLSDAGNRVMATPRDLDEPLAVTSAAPPMSPVSQKSSPAASPQVMPPIEAMAAGENRGDPRQATALPPVPSSARPTLAPVPAGPTSSMPPPAPVPAAVMKPQSLQQPNPATQFAVPPVGAPRPATMAQTVPLPVPQGPLPPAIVAPPPVPSGRDFAAAQDVQQRSITDALTQIRSQSDVPSTSTSTSTSTPPPAPVARPMAGGPPLPPTQLVVPSGDVAEAKPDRTAAPQPIVPVLPAAPEATPMSTYWALRPGERPEPVLPRRDEIPAMAPVGLPQANLASVPLGNDPRASVERRPEPILPTAEPSGQDLEAMQNLIQQLATQLNKPIASQSDAAEPRHATAIPSRPASVSDDAAISQSVAALRQIADTMHRPADDVVMSRSPAQPSPGTSEGPIAKPVATAAIDALPVNSAVATDPGPSPYARLAVIAEAVAADRMDLFLDPILALDDRKARHFEVSVRLRDDHGGDLAAEDFAPIIAGTGLLARIDAAKLTRTAAIADRLAQRGTNASLFANLQAESLADNGFLDAFADTFVDQAPLCTRLVLSFAQADVRDFADVHWEAIATMAELGFRFALEHVTDLDMDFEMLEQHGFSFVKLDASAFLEGMQAGDQTVPSADICRHLADLGFGLIVGGIVDEIDLAKIIGFGVVLGQGALFGAPRAVQVEVKAREAA